MRANAVIVKGRGRSRSGPSMDLGQHSHALTIWGAQKLLLQRKDSGFIRKLK